MRLISASRRHGGGSMVKIRQSFAKNYADEGHMEREGGGQQPDTTMQPQIQHSKYRKDYAKAQIGSDRMN